MASPYTFPWTLQVLEEVIRDEFILIAQSLEMPSHETEFLDSVYRKLHDVGYVSQKVHRLFRYVNRLIYQEESTKSEGLPRII